ncbi:MAG: MarR family transcriptional regulator [Alphaproteobacteria bacterium]|nr:MarR family transcriptional regulator [Alphaproteobacteria bacterium]
MPKSVENLSDDDIAAWARLVRVSQTLLMQVETGLKAAGFPPLPWYDALLELKRAGAGGLRPFQLQERMLLAQYNLSRLVDRLVASGYVARLPSTEDGRGQILNITKEGRALLRRMWPTYRAEIQAHFAERLNKREIRDLGNILGKLRE